MWWLLYTTLTIHTYICIFIYIRMRYYNVNIYLQQLVPVSFWALFIICFLAHFSITDPSVCPRVSFSSVFVSMFVRFFFGWVCYCFQIRNPSGTCLALYFLFLRRRRVVVAVIVRLCVRVRIGRSLTGLLTFWYSVLFCVDFCLKSRFNAYVIYENNTRTDVDDNVRPLRTFSHVDDGQTCREEITTHTRI